MNRFLCSLCVILGSAIGTFGQAQSAAPPVRDEQAVAAIQQAVVALGGPKAAATIQSVLAQGSIAPAPGSAVPAGNFSFEDQINAQGHEFKDSFRSPGLNQDFVSGHGSPGVVSNTHTKNFMPHVANSRLALHLPIMILTKVLADSNYTLSFIGQVQANGKMAIQVRIHIDTDVVQQTLSIQDWFFDPVTFLPVRLEYRTPDTSNPLYFVNSTAEFSDYRPVQGILIPFLILGYTDGVPQTVLNISSATINQPSNSSDFDLPAAVSQ